MARPDRFRPVILELHGNGSCPTAICKLTGVSISYVYKVLRRASLTPNRSPYVFSPAEREELISMIKSGIKYKQIAEYFGTSRSTVCQIAVGMGLRRRPPRRKTSQAPSSPLPTPPQPFGVYPMTLLSIKAACEAVGLPRLSAPVPTHDNSTQLTNEARDAAIFALGKQGDAGELALAVARVTDRVFIDVEATSADNANTIFAVTKSTLAEWHPELNPLVVSPLVARALGAAPLVLAELAWRREGR